MRELPKNTSDLDFRKLFEAAPGLYLVLSPDLKIIAASNAYLKATMTNRTEIIGRPLFDVFPENPDDLISKSVSNLSSSLQKVLAKKAPDVMALQKYDIRRPKEEGGGFEVRYWSPLNSPVLNDANEVIYIIHQVEDVTEYVRMKEKEQEQLKSKQELELSEKIHIQKSKKSEDRFLRIFNMSPIVIYMINFVDQRFICVNKAFEKLFQVKNEDAVGKTSIELNIFSPEKRAELTKIVIETNGFVEGHEIEIISPTGEKKHMLASSEVIEADNTSYLLVAMIDITQRKKSEEELKKTNHFLDTILENIPNMVFVKDAKDLRFIRFNKAGEELLGYSKKDLIGKNDYDFFPKEQADFFTSKDRDVLNKGKLLDITEEPIQTKIGERWLHTKKIPIPEENNEYGYLMGISEDITEKKKQEDAIKQLNKELEAFSYSVSHDLRAPLRAVHGYATMLEEDYSLTLDEEGKRQLHIIKHNAEKMGQLIDDLLSFSRLGRKEMQTTDINMNELVEGALIEINKTTTHHAKIKIGQLHPLKSDYALMNQVMINLISNAIKYSSKKEAPVVEINSELAANEVIFAVKDNGAGFDMRYVDKLFGVFQRLHTADEFEGAGVGLAIVQRITNKHGGRAWAEGKVDKGATFYFSIPINNTLTKHQSNGKQ